MKNEKKIFVLATESVLVAIAIIQLSVLVYFNIKLLGNHMGFDSSWTYLKSALIWKEKSLNSPIWTDQTSVFFDSSMILATLLYGVTGNLFVSYGTANIIVLALILVAVWKILDSLNIKRNSRLVAINMIICPYLTNGFNIGNDLGYFNDLLSGPAFYSLRVLIILIIVFEFIHIKQKKHIDLLGYFSLALCFLAGTSSGIFIIIMIFLPYVIYEIEMVLIDNDWNYLKAKESVYAYLGCISVIAGKIFASKILGIQAIDTSRTWISIEKIWINMGGVFQGLMKLLGVLPIFDTNISVLSREGFYRIFPMIILFIIIISILFCAKALTKNLLYKDGILLFLINIVVINFIVFSLFNAQYGEAIFEERYLISPFIIIVITVAIFFDQTDEKKIFSQLALIGIIIALAGNNYVSDKKYVGTTNDYWQMDEIASIVNEQDAQLIYFWGDDINIIGRAMRVYDLDHVYKEINTNGEFYHWGDYLYYEKQEDYSGRTILITPKDTNIVPENVMNQYVHIQDLDMVSIYRCEGNPISIKN